MRYWSYWLLVVVGGLLFSIGYFFGFIFMLFFVFYFGLGVLSGKNICIYIDMFVKEVSWLINYLLNLFLIFKNELIYKK